MQTKKREFSQQAEEAQAGLLREMWYFLRQNRKWYLVPLLVVLLIVGVMIVLSGTVAAPLIYTLF